MVEGEGGGVGGVEGVAVVEGVDDGVGEAVDRCVGCCVGVSRSDCVVVWMLGCVVVAGVVWLGPSVAGVDVLRRMIFNSLHREYIHIEKFCVSVSLFCSFFA